MFRRISFVAIVAALIAPLSAQITIDFETKGDGSPWLVGPITGSEWSNLGIEFHSHYQGVGNPTGLPAYIFDSSPNTDPNIGTQTSTIPADLNNVMTVWDARPVVGTNKPFTGEGGLGLTLNLLQPFSELKLIFIDIDDNRMGDSTSVALWSGVNFKGYFFAPFSWTFQNNTLTEMTVPGVVDGLTIDRVDINLKGDGALAEVVLIPEPATVAALVGIGALAFASWTRARRRLAI